MKQYYYADKIILDHRVVCNAYLEVNQGIFGKIHQDAPHDGDIIDYSDAIIAPGYVETHIHGYLGHDVMDHDMEGIRAMAQGLLATGVTSWLPTSLTSSRESLDQVCQMLGEHHASVEGAKIQGLFLEGPFFSEVHKGAQNPKYMSDPSKDALARWYDLSQGLLRKIAIAPEREGVTDFVRFAKMLGVHVALAHSDATYDQAAEAVDEGASIFVHTFNGMRGLHHREPGMVGAALTLHDVYAEVIADGHHVHPAAIDVILKSRGVKETVLITDSMRAAGQGEGESMLGEFPVVVKDGMARLRDGGSLAGSVLEMHQAVQNVVRWGLVSLEDAVRMASLNAAKSVNIDDRCGRIHPGYAADFLILDNQANLLATYLNGDPVYTA